MGSKEEIVAMTTVMKFRPENLMQQEASELELGGEVGNGEELGADDELKLILN